MTGMQRYDAGDHWVVPAAEHPVRGRVRLPEEVSAEFPSPLAAAVFAAAAVVTGGTVLVRNPPTDGSDALSTTAREVFDRAGGYVVRSADGLTVTTRATSGELSAVDIDLAAARPLMPLIAVIAAVAGGRSVLRGITGPGLSLTVANLRAVGVDAAVAGGVLVLEAVALRPGHWASGGDPTVAAAGLVLGLVVPGTEVSGMRELRRVLPGIEKEWLRLLSADEYLIPGSARLPHDYL